MLVHVDSMRSPKSVGKAIEPSRHLHAEDGAPIRRSPPGWHGLAAQARKSVSHLTVTSATLSDSTPAAGSKANPGDLIFLTY